MLEALGIELREVTPTKTKTTLELNASGGHQLRIPRLHRTGKGEGQTPTLLRLQQQLITDDKMATE